jgi:hypothetical protein
MGSVGRGWPIAAVAAFVAVALTACADDTPDATELPLPDGAEIRADAVRPGVTPGDRCAGCRFPDEVPQVNRPRDPGWPCLVEAGELGIVPADHDLVFASCVTH